MPQHFTASAFVTHAGRVLLIRHRRKGVWLPPGGHVEPDEAPAVAARREVFEETGLRTVITSPCVPEGAVPPAAPRPEASLEIEVEPGHTHLDLVYFASPAQGCDPAALRPNAEVAAFHWWSPAELRAGVAAAGGGGLPYNVALLALRALGASAHPPQGTTACPPGGSWSAPSRQPS